MASLRSAAQCGVRNAAPQTMAPAFSMGPVNCRWSTNPYTHFCQTRTDLGWHFLPSVPGLRPIQYNVVNNTGKGAGDGGGDSEAKLKEDISGLESKIKKLEERRETLWEKEKPSDAEVEQITAITKELAAEKSRLAGKEAAAGQKKNLFSWIKSFKGFEHHKYEYSRLAKSTFNQRLGRDESLKQAYHLYTNQLRSVEKNPRHSLKAVIGAPGSGKSFFLDELGRFHPADVDTFCNDNDNSLLDSFKSALSISISYNGNTSVSNQYDRSDAGLQARILYKYIEVLRPDLTFADFFFEFCQTDYSIHSVQTCVEFVASHFFSGSLSSVRVVFLGVDEVSKSKSEDDVLSSVGALADTPFFLVDRSLVKSKSKSEDDILSRVADTPFSLVDRSLVKVLPMVTSLSKGYIAAAMAKSNRTIDFIPLPSDLDGAAQAMVQELELKHGAVVEMMCRDVGNHGRMLEYIYGELREGGARNSFTGISEFRDAMNAVPGILAIVTDRGFAYFTLLRRYPLDLYNAVGTAILGSRVSVNDKPSQHSSIYGDLQESGLFLGDNSSTDKDFIIPVMSPLQISVWADCVMGLKGCPRDHYDTAMNLKRIFLPRAEHTWQDFEYFHLGFELVCRRFRGNVTIRQFYCLDEHSDENALSHSPSPILDFVMDNSDVRLLERASKKWDWTTTRPGTIPGTTSIQLAAEGQKACDLAILQKIIEIPSQQHNPPQRSGSKKRHSIISIAKSAPSLLILVQNKWSSKEDQTDTDRSTWLDEVNAAERGRVANSDRLFVYAAARRVPSLQNPTRHISNVVILSSADLKRLYGPTISGAHCFQLQSIATRVK